MCFLVGGCHGQKRNTSELVPELKSSRLPRVDGGDKASASASAIDAKNWTRSREPPKRIGQSRKVRIQHLRIRTSLRVSELELLAFLELELSIPLVSGYEVTLDVATTVHFTRPQHATIRSFGLDWWIPRTLRSHPKCRNIDGVKSFYLKLSCPSDVSS